jgi:Zn-dependent protease
VNVSGGSGQPRSGNDQPTDHPAGPTTPTTNPADHPDTAPPPDPQPATTPPTTDAATHPASPEPTPDASTDAPDPEPDPTSDDESPATSPKPTSDDASTATSPEPAPDEGTTATSPAPTTGADAGPTPPAPKADGDTPATHPAPAPAEDTPPAKPQPANDHDAQAAHPEPDAEHDGQGVSPQPTAGEQQGTGTGAGQQGGGGAAEGAGGTEHRTLAHSGIAKQEPPQPRPKEPGGGILMGRPFGVPVYVAPSWFLVAVLITWVFGGQLDRILPELGAARYLVSLFFAVAFYASVLVHELAHTVAAIRFKLPVRRIQLQFFGGVSEIEKEAETPGREFVLAFVGPLLSLVLAGVFYLALKPVAPDSVPGVLLAGLMISNLIVAIFNLLPGLPLDGGRMLRAVVWKITGKPMSGTVAAAWVGRALALSVLVGLPLLNQSDALGGGGDLNGMDTVTDALLAAILAAIIWTGAGNSLRMARLREHLPELRARTLTRRAVPVQTDTPLSEALRRANAAGARALVVVDAEGNPLSLVREAAIVGVPEHRRPWVAVSGLAQDLTDGMRVSAELAGEELLDTLRATPATEYLVVEQTGEIYGVLSAADVERAFVKAMARPS